MRLRVIDGRPAIDVKDRQLYHPSDDLDAITDRESERIYEGLQLAFWEHSAPSLAQAFGYGDVYQEGRSGGWLVVEGVPAFWEYDEADLSAAERDLDKTREWLRAKGALVRFLKGDDPEGVQEDYDDALERATMAEARDTFRNFEDAIGAEIEYLRDQFLEQVAQAAERARREPAEAADCAARDIVTID